MAGILHIVLQALRCYSLNYQHVSKAVCPLSLTCSHPAASHTLVFLPYVKFTLTQHFIYYLFFSSSYFFLSGVEEKLDDINQLKVKSLVIGPLHTVQADQMTGLNLQEISAELGKAEDLDSLLKAAHKKGT